MNKNNTGKKQSAIIVASEGDHVEIMKLLLHHDQTFVNQKNAIGQSALSVALKKCSNRPYRQNPFRIVKLLLRCPKAEIKTEYTYKSEIMDYIDLRQTVQESNPTCCLKVNLSLLGAAGEGDYRALRGLLQCPGSKSNINTVNIKGQSPLYIASMMGHIQAVNVLR